MVTWKEVHVQEEMRKVRMAQAEQARMVKAANAKEEAEASKKTNPYLLVLGAATRLVKAADNLRARRTDLSLAGEG